MAVIPKWVLQTSFAVAGFVPVVAGLLGVFEPGAASGSTGSWLNHARYLSGLLLAIGLTFWMSIPSLERHTARIRLLAAIVVTGGLCRLLGVVLGDPLTASVAGALVMELVVTPLLCFGQSRIAPSHLRGPNKADPDDLLLSRAAREVPP